MDSERDVFYIKSTDVSGVPMPLRTFAYEEIVRTQPSRQIDNGLDTSQYATREELEELRQMIQDRNYQRRENRNGEQAFSRNSKQQSNG